MYLSCVKIKNFRGYGENIDRVDKCYVYEDLDAPLVIFKGYNGFGKTSFYEAIEWCLTDNVHRLEKFYEDRTYQVNEIKKSHYLKFYHPIQGNTLGREIYVELIFNNGLRIVRKSKSNVLRTTKNDKLYKSSVFMGHDKLSEVENKMVLDQFISKAKNLDVFFHTHMLGQESISDFLRHNSPSKRREIFMQLLQEEELNSLFQKVQKYTNNGNILSKSINELDTQIDINRKSKKEIEYFISNFNFNNIKEYIIEIQKYNSKIKQLSLEKKALVEDLDVSTLIKVDTINIENCVNFLQNASFSIEKLTSKSKMNRTKKEELNRLNNRLQFLKILNTSKLKITNADHAKKLIDNDFDIIEKQLEELRESRQKENELLKKNEDYLKEVYVDKDILSTLKTHIKRSNFEISEALWLEVKKDQGRLKQFYLKHKKLIDEENIETFSINGEMFGLYQSKYESFLLDIQNKSTKLEEVQQQKELVSSLNEEYQITLSLAKKLLIENPNINNCPVCLNEDFSNPKYSKINNWNQELSKSEKILAIIDDTSSAGDKRILELSRKESGILDDINSTRELIKIEVIDELIKLIDDSRNNFSNNYREIERSLRKKEKQLLNNIDKLDIECKRVNEKYNALLNSKIALFGSKNIKLDRTLLQEFIFDKEQWFKQHSSKYDVLKNPVSLTEIEHELAILDVEGFHGETEKDISNSIKKINEKEDFIKKILLELNELIKLKVPVEYESFLRDFDQLNSKLVNLTKKVSQIKSYKSQVNLLHGKLLNQQRRVVKERLEKHPIISWVYETINPHPFHKKLHITNTERGTNFIGEKQLDDKVELYLDQMFSAAQLNILALSIFLGLGLTQRYSKLNQLFLDDPIQSMDDVNILALIDVIRAIMDSKYKDKHIVISTHNEDFAQLIAIKMRNRDIVQYNITGYTEEGPKIEKNRIG